VGKREGGDERDHKAGLEIIQDLLGRVLTEFVDLLRCQPGRSRCDRRGNEPGCR